MATFYISISQGAVFCTQGNNRIAKWIAGCTLYMLQILWTSETKCRHFCSLDKNSNMHERNSWSAHRSFRADTFVCPLTVIFFCVIFIAFPKTHSLRSFFPYCWTGPHFFHCRGLSSTCTCTHLKEQLMLLRSGFAADVGMLSSVTFTWSNTLSGCSWPTKLCI